MASTATKQQLPAKVKLQKYLIYHQLAQSNRHVKKLIHEGLVFVNGVEARSVSIKVTLDEKNGSVFVKQQPSESSSSSSTCRTTDKESSTTSLTNGDHQKTNEANKHHQQQPAVVEEQQQDANNNNPCILFYKPCGMICTTTATSSSNNNPKFDDDTTTLVNISPPLPPGFHAVGRLDQHSHGLLLCSCDGRLTSALLSPKSRIPREYTVIVQGDVVGDETHENIIQNVKNGVQTKYGTFKGCILEMKSNVDRDYVHSHCDPNRGSCRTDKYEDVTETRTSKGPPTNTNTSSSTGIILSSITIQVEEGKNRMVRRLFAALNLHVLDLKRNKYGGMELLQHDLHVHDDGNNKLLLKPGQWRFANVSEVVWCRNLIQAWNDGGKGWDKCK